MASSKEKIRTCIACGKQSSKGDLRRIVKTAQGAVFFDATGRASGRGAYVCSGECLKSAVKTTKLNRALKCALTNDDYERIVSDFHKVQGEA